MALKSIKDCHQLCVDRRKLALEVVERFGVANARHHVFTLSVNQKVAIRFVFAGRRVASETHTRTRVVVTISKHHCLHVYCGAQIVADFFAHTVCNRSRTIPRTKHSLNRATQLLHRILWEFATSLSLDDLFVRLAQCLQCRCWQVCVTLYSRSLFGIIKRMLKLCTINAEHNASVHRNEAAVAVIRKTLVVSGTSQTNHALVIQTQIENRVHHARHRKLGSRAHRHQQRT